VCVNEKKKEAAQMKEIERESEAVIWEARRGSGNRYIQLKRKG
jgi:hypothetical protein